ncbi:MAG: hypothetical protein FJZ98_07240 [Chloroflexi bacterium]|nr:hypothetical protein [Chloroflexota bacterium]
MKINLELQVRQSCRHLLSEIDRDPANPTFGCFDRRYWAWKLVDFPEATYQRNLSNLAWYMKNCGSEADPEMISQSIIAGLIYTTDIQHQNGSFDQAFPFEQSFGATGFLLPDLIKAYRSVKQDCTEVETKKIDLLLKRSADFLCSSNEKHGLISNHLAGAALGLFMAADQFQISRFEVHARKLLDYILSNQSPEGWFPEYGGADPGYQTLCMHYLAQIYTMRPTDGFKKAIEQSLNFLQYFIHPNGSFGGEYGSRRTEVYYPGGISLLVDDFPLAQSIHDCMIRSIENLSTVTLTDIDMGNTAPLLSSSILALDNLSPKNSEAQLPFERGQTSKKFNDAGIVVFGNKRYYAVVGASNGGILKVFDKKSKKIIEDDCGMLAVSIRGNWISTQFTRLDNQCSLDGTHFEGRSGFYAVSRQQATPANYLILRLLNLTVMRIRFLNEMVKKLMVSWLIRSDKSFRLERTRTIDFHTDQIRIKDQVTASGSLRLKNLLHAGKFNAIHMASSRYYSGSSPAQPLKPLEVQPLNEARNLEVSRVINLEEGAV